MQVIFMYICPICQSENCSCGFENVNQNCCEDELLFRIFKYTKNVFLNRIAYEPSTLEMIYEEHNKKYVDIVSKPRGLEIVKGNVVACNGILAFYYQTKALILDCDYAHKEFLDESRLRILFLGKDFKGFIGDPLHMDRIKYIYVHPDNPYFEADNNILKKKR